MEENVDDLLYGNLDEAPLIDSLKSPAASAPLPAHSLLSSGTPGEGPSPAEGQPIQTLDQQKRDSFQQKLQASHVSQVQDVSPPLLKETPEQKEPKSVLLNPNVTAQG
jgi:hypothetical protein